MIVDDHVIQSGKGKITNEFENLTEEMTAEKIH